MYYAFAAVALLPIGMVFFAFALTTVVRGVMSVGFGELHRDSLDSIVQNCLMAKITSTWTQMKSADIGHSRCSLQVVQDHHNSQQRSLHAL